MRRFLIAGWLLMPVGAWAYHEGPGQEGLQLDGVDAELVRAERAVAAEKWADAVKHYEAAFKELPDLDTPARVRAAKRIELSKAKARLEASQLIDARTELMEIVAELEAAVGTENEANDLLAEAKEAFANAQYYYTWLMRLEGYPRSEWEPELEVSRQNFRLLAEQADDRGDGPASAKHSEDLEAAIKLGQLDLEELQGLPLPSQ